MKAKILFSLGTLKRGDIVDCIQAPITGQIAAYDKIENKIWFFRNNIDAQVVQCTETPAEIQVFDPETLTIITKENK